MMLRRQFVCTASGVVAVVTAVMTGAAQRLPITDSVKPFVSVNAPVVALVNARVIDGTGGPARADHTLILRDGRIAALGETARTRLRPRPA
jgi:hypothetical protein